MNRQNPGRRRAPSCAAAALLPIRPSVARAGLPADATFSTSEPALAATSAASAAFWLVILPPENRHTTFSECFLSGRVPAAGEVLSGRADGTPIAASIMLTPPRNVEFQRNTAMSRGNEQYSNYNSALYTVYGSSLGLLALLGRSSKLRVVTAL